MRNRDEELNTVRANANIKSIETGDITSSLADAELAQARAQYQLAIARRDQYRIRAPFAGVVGFIGEEVRPGELIQANTRAASVVNNKGFQVRVKVPERSVLRITEGLDAKITLDADQSIVLDGKLITLSQSDSELEGSRVYEGIVTILQPEKSDDTETPTINLRTGLGARVSIQLSEPKNVLAIPESAIRKEGEQSFVSVQDSSGDFTDRIVVPGTVRSNGYVEILSGLSDGEIIRASQPEAPVK